MSSNKWTEVPYPGRQIPYVGIDKNAGEWKLNYFKRDENGNFLNLDGEIVSFEIANPCTFNFDKELKDVMDVQKTLTPEQIALARYYGNGVPLNQIYPVIITLINTYGISPVYSSRIFSVLSKAINDAFIITWHFKYHFDYLRPIQLNPNFKPLLNTPLFPSYPSGHSVVSKVACSILSYFFQSETSKLDTIADNASISRLYGGIHFRIDLEEGKKLGSQIAKIVINEVKKDCEKSNCKIDKTISEYLNADIIPNIEIFKPTNDFNNYISQRK